MDSRRPSVIILLLCLLQVQSIAAVQYFTDSGTSRPLGTTTQSGAGSTFGNLQQVGDNDLQSYAESNSDLTAPLAESSTVTVQSFAFNTFPAYEGLAISGLQFEILSTTIEGSTAALSLASVQSGGKSGSKYSTADPSPNINAGFPSVPGALIVGNSTDVWGVPNWQLSDLPNLTFSFRYVRLSGNAKIRIHMVRLTVHVSLSMSVNDVIPGFGYALSGRSADVPGAQEVIVTGGKFHSIGGGNIECRFGTVYSIATRVDADTLRCNTTLNNAGTGGFAIRIDGYLTSEPVTFEYRVPCPGEPFCSGALRGNCVNGTCQCNSGWTGAACETATAVTSSTATSTTGTGTGTATSTQPGTTIDSGTATQSGTTREEVSDGKEESSSLGLTLGLVFSVIGVCALVVILAIVLFMRSRKTGHTVAKFVPPNFLETAFGKQLVLQYILPANYIENTKNLAEILLREDLKLVAAVAAVTAPTEADTLAKSLTYLFLGTGKFLPMLLGIIDAEIEVQSKTNTAKNVLFRGDSLATKIFQAYSRVVGLPYLWETLGNFLVQLDSESDQIVDISSGQSSLQNTFEVDPEKVSAEQKEFLAVNKYKLMTSAQTLLVLLFKSSDSLPSTIRKVCAHVSEKVAEDFRYTAIGALLFLRLIVPTVTTPHVYGIFKEPPQANTQRKLILLSKTLQNLANGTTFGGKEEYMTKLSDLVVENKENFHRFFDNVVNGIPSVEEKEELAPQNVRVNALCFMHTHISKNIGEKLAARLSESDNSELKTAIASSPLPTKV